MDDGLFLNSASPVFRTSTKSNVESVLCTCVQSSRGACASVPEFEPKPCAILWPVARGPHWPQVIDLSRTRRVLQNELTVTFDSTSGSRQIHGTTLSNSGHRNTPQCQVVTVCAPPRA